MKRPMPVLAILAACSVSILSGCASISTATDDQTKSYCGPLGYDILRGRYEDAKKLLQKGYD